MNVGRRIATVVIGMAAEAVRAVLDLRASSRRRSNSSCSDIICYQGHQ